MRQSYRGFTNGGVTGLADELPIVIWEADPATFAFSYVSNGAEQFLGYPASQWTEEPTFWRDHIHPEDRSAAVALCEAATAQGMDHDFDYRMITARGEVRWVRDLVRVERDEHGRVTRLSGVLIDQTRSRTATAALERSEQLFRAIFEDAAGGMVVLRPDGSILLANTSASCRSGYRAEELVSRNVLDLLHPDDRPRTAEVLAGYRDGQHTSLRYESRYIHRDGRAVNVLITTALAQDHGGQPLVIVQLHDVTERDRLTHELLQAQKLEAIGRLAAGVAHDFNNVLTVIATTAEFIAADMDRGDQRRADLLQIRKATEIGSSLSKQLLSFTRRQPGAPRVVGVNALVTDTMHLLQRTLGRNLVVEARLSPDALNIRIDPTQLEQVIMNLALNARDAMPEGGTITLATDRVRLQAPRGADERPGDYARLTVTDTGTGMDAATRARIFEPFFSTKPPEKGSGLGLPTVYRIVQQQGGFIRVDSAPGRGTRFELYFRMLETD